MWLILHRLRKNGKEISAGKSKDLLAKSIALDFTLDDEDFRKSLLKTALYMILSGPEDARSSENKEEIRRWLCHFVTEDRKREELYTILLTKEQFVNDSE